MISDVLVRKAKKSGSGGLVGKRTQVVLAYTVATGLALFAFSMCPNIPALQWFAVAAVGFCLYGPQMLIGLCGAEVRFPLNLISLFPNVPAVGCRCCVRMGFKPLQKLTFPDISLPVDSSK